MLQGSEAGQVVAVTDETFAERVLGAAGPVVVDFWAEWCPPCRAISTSLAELAEEFGDRLVVTTLDIDENPVSARTYGIMSLPTLLVFRRGEVVGSVVGSRPKAWLRQTLAAHAAAT